MTRWYEPVSARGQDLLRVTAVQIAVKEDGMHRIVEHLGSPYEGAKWGECPWQSTRC